METEKIKIVKVAIEGFHNTHATAVKKNNHY